MEDDEQKERETKRIRMEFLSKQLTGAFVKE